MANTAMANTAMKTATFGAGRFWMLEAVFQQVRGVKLVQSGYAGGALDYPNYEEVCGGETGHAEVIHVQFDTEVVSYQVLLDIFFKIHDPCSLAQDDELINSPHRSIIFFHCSEQKKTALDSMRRLQRFSSTPLRTSLMPFQTFFLAEDAHQNFYKNHRLDSYCQEFILPKINLARDALKRRLAA